MFSFFFYCGIFVFFYCELFNAKQGAHSLGRLTKANSGVGDGSWTPLASTFSNFYYLALVGFPWNNTNITNNLWTDNLNSEATCVYACVCVCLFVCFYFCVCVFVCLCLCVVCCVLRACCSGAVWTLFCFVWVSPSSLIHDPQTSKC